jgi:hypothetical protein
VSLIQSSIVITREVLLNGSKTMNMPSQNWLYLDQKNWNDDEIKKLRVVHNAQNIGLVDTIFEELVSDKSITVTCNFLRSHAISNIRKKLQDKFTELASQSSKRDKVKNVSALSNEIQFKKHAAQMKNQPQYHQLKLQWYVNRRKYHLRFR